MGDFRITINAVGDHGCERDKGDGETLRGCGRMDCPDCLATKFVADLRRIGVDVKDAQIAHWPEQTGQVLDVVDPAPQPFEVRATRTRIGSF